MSLMSLKGNTAIVTGTKRIGAKVAKRLSEEGIYLAILYNSSEKQAISLSESLES